MDARIALLQVVALTEDLPSRGLLRGQVGTVVEKLDDDVFEVEFADEAGRTYVQAPLRSDQLMVLRYAPIKSA